MQLRYADEFTFSLTVGKAAGLNYFTVAYSAGPPVTHTFGTAFPTGGGAAGSNASAFAVPITLLDSAGATVAKGYVTSWDLGAAGTENRVYVDAALTAAVAYAGDTLACRLRANHVAPGALSYYNPSIIVSALNATVRLAELGEHPGITLENTGLSIELPDLNHWYGTSTLTNDRPAPRHFAIVVSSETTTNTFTFTSGTVMWEGVAPTFAAGTRNRVLVELWHESADRWFGRWIGGFYEMGA